jgi:hypothetical protein
MFWTKRAAWIFALIVGGAAGTLHAQQPTTPSWFTLSATPQCHPAPPVAPAVDLYWPAQPQALSYQVFQDGAPVALMGGPLSRFQVTPLAAGQTYTFFVRSSDEQGAITDSSTVTVTVPPGTCPMGGGSCPPGAVCSDDGRFQATAHWLLPSAGGIQQSGAGTPVPLSDDTGGFWFVDPSSLDLMVKVLDGTSVNGYFWVFYGALSNTEYYLDVYDTQTSSARQYYNPAGTLASFADTAAFAATPPPPSPGPAILSAATLAAEVSGAAGARGAAGAVGAGSAAGAAGLNGAADPAGAATAAAGVDQAIERMGTGLAAPVRAAGQAGPAVADGGLAVAEAGQNGGACVPGTGALCGLDGRFQVTVAWSLTVAGAPTAATAVPLTDGTGYFWFFASTNAELLVKLLDGRSVNGHFWFFYGALSDVAYTINVTDTTTGIVRTYQNPAGNLASVADIDAF